MLAAPSVLALDHEAPQRDATEDAADDAGLVAARQVDERGLRVTRGVDPARALETWSGMAVRAPDCAAA